MILTDRGVEVMFPQITIEFKELDIYMLCSLMAKWPGHRHDTVPSAVEHVHIDIYEKIVYGSTLVDGAL